MKKFIATFFVFVVMALPPVVRGDVQVSGLSDFVVRNSSEADVTNYTFRGFSNFHTIRTRLFFDGLIDDKKAFFVQVLVNLNTFQLYGAYAQFTDLAGHYLNMNIGIIPNTIGSYGPRTYSDKNPLIGTPLLYSFHTAIDPSELGAVGTFAELDEARDDRYYSGMPFIYDACWNTGAEFYGSAGKLDYSLGLLIGSVTHPALQQAKDVPQVTTHFTYNFQPGFKLGFSAYLGPYLVKDDLTEYAVPLGNLDPNDYLNGGIGYELYLSQRFLEIYSEGYYTYWEYPGLPKLKSMAGYLEAKYKIITHWYLAGRFDLIEPSKTKFATGENEKWDYPLKRYEFGIGYKPLRTTTVKLVTQLNRFDIDHTYNNEIYALQVSMEFR